MRIKICFYAKDIRGGTQIFLHQMKGLDKRLFHCKFFYYKKDKLVKYNYQDRFINIYYPIVLSFSFEKVILFVYNLRKTYKNINKEKPGIVFACDVYSSILLDLVKIMSRKKFCLIHLINNNYYLIIKQRSGFIYKNLILLTFRILSSVCNVAVFTSSQLAKFSVGKITRKGVDRKIIPNGVNVFLDNKTGKKLVNRLCDKKKVTKIKLITVGRLDEQKDFQTILRAFKRIIKEFSNCKLVIVGDGYLKNDLINYSKELGIYEKTLFTGWVRNVYKHLRTSDLFLFSSNYEGFGMVVVEAMAVGVPVVATDSPFGPREVLGGGKYGVLVSVGDDIAMAEESIKLLGNKKRLKRLSIDGIKRAKDYSVKRMLDMYEKLFLCLVKQTS